MSNLAGCAATIQGSIESMQDRKEVLSAWLLALNHFGEIAAIVSDANFPTAARMALAQRFSISERQAQAILEMQVQNLGRLQRAKIVRELEDLTDHLSAPPTAKLPSP